MFIFYLTAVMHSLIIAGRDIIIRVGRKTLVHLQTGKFPIILESLYAANFKIL